jgi:hypothetical protein
MKAAMMPRLILMTCFLKPIQRKEKNSRQSVI